MITRKALIANAAALIFSTCPQLVSAEEFTGADVLEWSEEQQDSFFQTSVNMIGIVATRTGKHDAIAGCIDAWHGGGPASQSARSEEIRKAMQELSEYHPQVVILVVIERECGRF